MYMDELDKKTREIAIDLVIDELKRSHIELDKENRTDRHKAFAIAINLRIRFNERGGLS